MQKSRERLHRSPPRTSGKWAGAHPLALHPPPHQVPGPWLSPESLNLPFHPTPNPVLNAQPQYHSRGKWDLLSGDWGKSLNLSFSSQPRPDLTSPLASPSGMALAPGGEDRQRHMWPCTYRPTSCGRGHGGWESLSWDM